jgi:hypothetical protein
MSKSAPDQQFWDLANSFIHRANEQSATVDPGKVSAALLYAAARFNAFVVASGTDDEDSFRNARKAAMEYFTAEFNKMLGENLDDWAKHYTKYKQVKRDADA